MGILKMNNINVIDLNGIVFNDYYYPDYLGTSGYVLKYLNSSNEKILFFLSGYDFKLILKNLCLLNFDLNAQIVESFLDGGFNFSDDIMESWVLINDKQIFISNLSDLLYKNASLIQMNCEESEDLQYVTKIREILSSLKTFLEESGECHVYIINI